MDSVAEEDMMKEDVMMYVSLDAMEIDRINGVRTTVHRLLIEGIFFCWSLSRTCGRLLTLLLGRGLYLRSCPWGGCRLDRDLHFFVSLLFREIVDLLLRIDLISGAMNHFYQELVRVDSSIGGRQLPSTIRRSLETTCQQPKVFCSLPSLSGRDLTHTILRFHEWYS